MVQKLKLSTNYFFKRCAITLNNFYSLKKKSVKICTFLEIALLTNCHRTGWIHKTWYFHLTTVESWSKPLLFRTHTAFSAKSRYLLAISFILHYLDRRIIHHCKKKDFSYWCLLFIQKSDFQWYLLSIIWIFISVF